MANSLHRDARPAWLRDLLDGLGVRAAAAANGTAGRCAESRARIGQRRERLLAGGDGEALGRELVHRAVHELLAQGAWPRAMSLRIDAEPGAAVAEVVVAGALRAAVAHGCALESVACCDAVIADVECTLRGDARATFAAPVPVGAALLALRARAPVDGEEAWVRARLASLGARAHDTELLRAIAAPSASQVSVLHGPLLKQRVLALAPVHTSLGAAVASLLAPGTAALLGDAPARGGGGPADLFTTLFDGAPWPQFVDVSSCGVDLVVAAPAAAADDLLAHFAAWNEPGWYLGRVARVADAVPDGAVRVRWAM